MTPALSTRNLRILTVIAATGAATVGGVFFAFSTFIMRALRRLPAPQGLAAMQSINREAPSPVFMAALLGTAAASAGLGAVAWRHRDDPASAFVLVGCGLYLAGVVLTVAYHVPRNDAFALVDPTSPSAVATWHQYVTSWTRWNHVRAATSIAGAVSFILALDAD